MYHYECGYICAYINVYTYISGYLDRCWKNIANPYIHSMKIEVRLECVHIGHTHNV